MTPDEAVRFLDRAVAQLGEHFDCVQILASWPDPDGNGTRASYRGGGNWFARQGMAHDFVEINQATTSAREIGRAIEPPPDDGEAWKEGASKP
jgi:hypothetical protein